ncbi:MAG: hypothetical protein V3U65_07650 [Granulosicoccaceae bacterium]
MKKSRNDLEQHLNDLEITFEVHEHPAVYTVEQAQQHSSDIPGCHCKNLFLKTKKNNYGLWCSKIAPALI